MCGCRARPAASSPATIIVVIALIGWAPKIRMLRSQTLSLRQRGFAAAALGFGAGPLYCCGATSSPGSVRW